MRLKLPRASAADGDIVARFTLTGAIGGTYVVRECPAYEASHFVNALPEAASKKYQAGASSRVLICFLNVSSQ
jgi:hypothetical protein